MAWNMRIALRYNLHLLGNNVTRANAVNGVRHLYSASSLGIDGYARSRERVNSQFRDMTDKFRSKMMEFVEDKSTNMIFTEDLKNMVHLLENKPEDIQLILQMMKKFNSQNKELRFGSFVFGPVAMRAFHFLDQPDAALSAFKDPILDGFFDQLVSYQILLDMLYNHERYQDIKEVFEIVKTRHTDGAKHPRHSVVLVLAACYKENTPESLEYALSLWKELAERGHIPMRRAATFLAGLALNQGSPHIALEVVGTLRQINYITVKNIKVAALADLDRVEDIVPLLRQSIEVDDPAQRKQNYLADVIGKLEAAMLRAKVEDTSEVAKCLRQLKQHDHIVDTTLDHHICSEIVAVPSQMQNQGDWNRQMLALSYDSQSRNDRFRRPQRPGLKDLI